MLKTNFSFDVTDYFKNWEDKKQLPKFELSNATRTSFIKENYEATHYKFTISNTGDGDGTILAWIGGYEQNASRSVYLEKKQAKEISMVVYNFPDELNAIGFTTYNAYNPKYVFCKFKKQRLANYIVPFEGERIVEFIPKPVSPDTVIVDDLDQNFKIVSQPLESFLKKYLNNKNEDELGFSGFNYRNPPSRWSGCDQDKFYGENDRTVCYKKSGKGNAKVSWDANLPVSGEYDIYYYVPSLDLFKIPSLNKEIYNVDDFHFFVTHESGVEEVVLNMLETKEGWNYLGTFRFSSDKAHVELTDKSKGDLVYADAVKFVKK